MPRRPIKPWNYVFGTALAAVAWVLLGSLAQPFGTPLPALGPFLNPGMGFWQSAAPRHTTLPQQDTVVLDHALARGEIVFDDRGVPHIFAGDRLAACFLQGYAHARDRLWQMDISTRSTEGTLSEVLGARTLEADRRQVRRGYRQMAQMMIDTIERHFPEDLAVLEAYAAGVNSYADRLEPEDYPVEYKLLGHTPLRWSPYRTALFIKGMSRGLSGRFNDAAATITRELLDGAAFARYFPERMDADKISPVISTPVRPRPGGPAAIPPAPSRSTAGPTTSQFSNYRPPHEAPHQPYAPFQPDPDIGSNNWAVAATHSSTRRPMLASDPHLGLTLPSIWHETALVYPGVNARGVGFPGAPGLAMGFNDHIAWGETNGGHDVIDWFRIEWTDSSRTAYLLDGEIVAAEQRVDTLKIRGAADEILLTPQTYFGPVPTQEGPYADYAMRYLAQDEAGPDRHPHSMAITFIHMLEATDYDAYRNAINGFVDPIQNFAFAAGEGNIAMSVNGFMPLRRPGTGRFLQDGTSRANAWQGYVPFADRPHERNPARGYVSSANQVSTGPDYPYYYFGYFDEYRGRYINRVLANTPALNQREMKELQNSTFSLKAAELTPLLIARLNRNQLTEEGRRLLRVISEWDYHYTAESRAPTLFEEWNRRVYQLTFDEFPRDSGYLRPDGWVMTQLIRQAPTDPIFDVAETQDFRETAPILIQRAFDELLEELAGELPEVWWRKRNARVPHLGHLPGFGSDVIRTGGGRSSPRVLADGFGGSWRMVVETGPNARGWGSLPGGPSGNPASVYYDSELADWAEGRYHELARWEDLEEARLKGVGRIVIQNQ